MKQLNIELSPEIKTVIENRRKKLLFAMYLLCIVIFTTITAKDIYYNFNNDSIIEGIALLLIALSFIFFYKNKKYDKASYTILFILGSTTIASIIQNRFDDYTPAFIIPFSISTFFLFSWKKGIFINILYFLALSLTIFLGKNYFSSSTFLENQLAVSNFIIVLVIIFVFTYFYEITRVEAYKLLLESNYKKDLLYRELQHRVKNNLNIVASMLAMQAQRESKEIQEIIQVSKMRIDSIAMVHSMLYVSDNIEKVDIKAFLEKLSQNLKSTFHKSIEIKLDIKKLELSLNEIIPIGLIINELLTNSFKYAFENTLNPKIVIIFNENKNNATLTYHDNGSGYNSSKTDNMGLKLVELNVKQLKGNIKVTNQNGLEYKITYKRSLHV